MVQIPHEEIDVPLTHRVRDTVDQVIGLSIGDDDELVEIMRMFSNRLCDVESMRKQRYPETCELLGRGDMAHTKSDHIVQKNGRILQDFLQNIV